MRPDAAGGEPRARDLGARRDLLLFSLLALWFLVDASNTSYWPLTDERALVGFERPFDRIIVALSFGFQSLYILANLRTVVRRWTAYLPLAALCFVACLSTLWSYSPAQSLNPALSLTATTLAVIVAIERHGQAVVVRKLILLLTGLLVVNMAAITLPGLSFMSGTLAGPSAG